MTESDIHFLKNPSPSDEGRKTTKRDSRPNDTVHCCKFCSILRTHIQDHLEKKHKDESGVLRIIEMKRKLKDETKHSIKTQLKTQIKTCQSLLRYEGDHIHNQKVVHSSGGELLVKRKKVERKHLTTVTIDPVRTIFYGYILTAVFKHTKRIVQDNRMVQL